MVRKTHDLLSLLKQDPLLKITALACAIALWVAVTFLGTRTVTIEQIPVGVVNLPPDVGLSEDLPKLTARLRVPRSLAVGTDPSTFVQAFVDLNGSGLGERTLPVTVSPVSVDVEVLDVAPSTVRVVLDPLVERQVPVRVVPDGIPQSGYRIGEVTAIPEHVRLRGPLARLRELSAGVDAHVSVEGATTSFESDVSLSLPPSIHAVDEHVRVSVAIEQAEETKTVGVRVVTEGSPADGYWVRTITTTPSSVTIRGAREVVEALTAIDTDPLSLNGAQAPIEADVRLRFPGGVVLASKETSVRARVDITPLEGTREVLASVSVVSIPEGLRVSSLSPQTVKVALRGRTEALQSLREEDVRIVLRADGRPAGTFTVRPDVDDVRAPEGIRAVSVDTRDVSVSMEES